jgi:DNA-binding CsgD family transcriptional regulator
MRAWFVGAFEWCLELCDAIHPRDAELRVHVALLKARALLRLNRADEALRALGDAAAIPCATDEAIAMRMLTGAGYVRRGDLTRGLETLLAVEAESASAHRTIRSEIALNVALARYGLRDFDAAERALDLVESHADIVYARALEYRGWIASAQGDGERATQMFRGALEAHDNCKHYDRFLEANCIRALARLALERLDRRTWAFVEERRARMDWSASGLAEPHFWITYCAAAFAIDVEGSALKAAREARDAERLAPSRAYRVEALCKRASIARAAGEQISRRDHIESAAELFEELDVRELAGDETLVPLVLADELAGAGLGPESRRVLDGYLKSARSSAMLDIYHTPATLAFQRLVQGAVAESAGERRTAARRYREAFEGFAAIGYRRRALLSALRLASVKRDETATAYAESEVRKLWPQSWMRREVEKTRTQAVKLTAVQREVLGLICQGKSNPEIARLRKRSLHTIRNLISRLFEVLEVSSREQLAVECVRRGLYTPK